MRVRTLIAVFAALLLTALAVAGDGWTPTLEKGLEAAKKSGRPVLVVTLWPPGV